MPHFSCESRILIGSAAPDEQVEKAVEHAKLDRDSGKPTMIILNTLKGCGVQWIVDLGAGNHNSNISEEQAAAAIREIRGED